MSTQPQIERRVDDADLEAGVFEIEVFGEKRKRRGEEVAPAEAEPDDDWKEF